MIDSGADDVKPPPSRDGGLFVIESIDNVSAVAAVNLAHAIHADIAVVAPLDEDEPRQILALIQEWKENDSATAYAAVEEKARCRIRHLPVDRFRFVTYFTAGLPYAFATAKAIPTSYVHLTQHATLFLFNAISAESKSLAGVAFIFALDELEMAGEASWLDQFLTERNYYVRSLVGSEATHDAFDYNALRTSIWSGRCHLAECRSRRTSMRAGRAR